MTKEFYNKMLLMSGLCLLSFSGPVSAQCVTPPTCSELGYTKSAADCEGHTFLKCPFDQSVGYCDLGTSSTPVPEPEPTPTYKVGDNYTVNGMAIGKIIEVNNNFVTIASLPHSQTNPSYEDLQTYCENLTLGDGDWHVPEEKNCISIASVFGINSLDDALIMSGRSCTVMYKTICMCVNEISSSDKTRYYSCIRDLLI